MTTSSRVLCTILSFAFLATACSGSGDDQNGDGLAVQADGSTSSVLDDGLVPSGSEDASEAVGSDTVLSVDADDPDASSTTTPGTDPSTSSTTSTSVTGSSSTGSSSTASTSSTTAPGSTTVATAGQSGGSSSTSAAGGGSSSTATTATTAPSTTSTTRATTTAPPSTTRPSSGGGGRFETLGPGAALPSGGECAGRVRSAPETRPGNASYNATPGNGAHDIYPRVDGNFTGTTDEIIQWAACKWGFDEDIVRAQAAIESWWDMTAGGDTTGDQSACHPRLRTSSGECPESIGLLQVRYLYHGEAFENENAIRSTAYNIDYTYAVMRDCYEGGSGWLNTVERGREYAGGDLQGCLGVWFSGRWYTDRAIGYIGRVNDYQNRRIWETSEFLNY